MTLALARLPLPVAAKPFVKYAGGKTRLLPELVARLPARFDVYHEPFVGGGALYWQLRNMGRLRAAVLSDTTTALIRAYETIQDDPTALIKQLGTMPNEEAFFYETRDRMNQLLRVDTMTLRKDIAASFIFLNKTCFNGLYRVNSKGGFNVPFGHYDKPFVCDSNTIFACHEALQIARIYKDDFESVLTRTKENDLVYFDPPYLPISRTSDFTSYSPEGFRYLEHVRLRDVALKLKAQGVHILISNSDCPKVRELYKDFQIDTIQAPRSVSAKGSSRGKVSELLIR